MSVQGTEIQFWQLGVEYYASARFAVRGGLILVCGNLFHHAIEMFLKAWLSRTLNNVQLRRLKHDLNKIWTKFKADFPDKNLDDFDDTIALLHKFERIRYPDRIVAEGAIINIGLYPDPSGAPQGRRPEPHYEIVVPEIDRLVDRIFEICSRNKKFFGGVMNNFAREVISWENPTAGW